MKNKMSLSSQIKFGSSLLFFMSFYVYLFVTKKILPTIAATTVNVKTESSLPDESGHKDTTSGTDIVELRLPVGEFGLLQHLKNDEVISAALKDRQKFYIVIIHADSAGDEARLRHVVYDYVSKVYSKLWDGAMQLCMFDIDCVVIYKFSAGDELQSLFCRSDSASKTIKKVYYCNPSTRSEIESSIPLNSPCEYIDTELLCQSLDRDYRSQNEILCFDMLYENSLLSMSNPSYSKVALGGTFDRLHNGHRKLLSLAAAVCERELTIGITGSAMLSKKSGADLISSYEERLETVRAFMKMVNPSLPCNMVQLEDPFGPTITDSDLCAIVVSSETVKGAFEINRRRIAKQMRPLSILVSLRADGASLSSSFLRSKVTHR